MNLKIHIYIRANSMWLVVKVMQKGKTTAKRSVPIATGLSQVDVSCDQLLSMISSIQQFVGEVLVSCLNTLLLFFLMLFVAIFQEAHAVCVKLFL